MKQIKFADVKLTKQAFYFYQSLECPVYKYTDNIARLLLHNVEFHIPPEAIVWIEE